MTQQTAIITINGRQYPMACAASEISRLQELAASIDQRLQTLKQQMGPQTSVSDSHLLVLNALIMADELAEKSAAQADTDLMISAVAHLTDRVTNIAQQLKSA